MLTTSIDPIPNESNQIASAAREKEASLTLYAPRRGLVYDKSTCFVVDVRDDATKQVFSRTFLPYADLNPSITKRFDARVITNMEHPSGVTVLAQLVTGGHFTKSGFIPIGAKGAEMSYLGAQSFETLPRELSVSLSRASIYDFYQVKIESPPPEEV